jgi:hypothetical protein
MNLTEGAMSLDLMIKSNTPVIHRGTGIYIRENGGSKELETKQEVLKYFPDVNPDTIEETSYEDDTYFHVNLTHNLTKMASNCKVIGTCNYDADSAVITLYDLLWHPKENLKIITPNLDYLEDLVVCYKELLQNPDFYKQYNPENGWGTYEQLVKATKEYIKALTSTSEEFGNYTIVADT